MIILQFRRLVTSATQPTGRSRLAHTSVSLSPSSRVTSVAVSGPPHLLSRTRLFPIVAAFAFFLLFAGCCASLLRATKSKRKNSAGQPLPKLISTCLACVLCVVADAFTIMSRPVLCLALLALAMVASVAASSSAHPRVLLHEEDVSYPPPRSSSPANSSRSSNCVGPDWYCNHWCGGPLEYLEDTHCIKAFPSTYDRDWTSPLRVSTVPPASEGWAQDTGSFADFPINNTALTSMAGDANICAILIRRVEGDPSPYFRFLCAEGDDINAYETWSSSKIYAMANAAGHIRDECPKSGMTSSTTGEHGTTPLGDLATVITTYDATAGYTSNGLSCYMHDLGYRERIQATLAGWHPTPTNLSLGGNYGVPTPPDLGWALDNSTCWTPRDRAAPRWNSLSMLAHSDLMRRLVLHDQLPAESQWPGMTLADAKTIMYGAETSLLFPGLTWGGMSADTQIFVQSAVGQ